MRRFGAKATSQNKNASTIYEPQQDFEQESRTRTRLRAKVQSQSNGSRGGPMPEQDFEQKRRARAIFRAKINKSYIKESNQSTQSMINHLPMKKQIQNKANRITIRIMTIKTLD